MSKGGRESIIHLIKNYHLSEGKVLKDIYFDCATTAELRTEVKRLQREWRK